MFSPACLNLLVKIAKNHLCFRHFNNYYTNLFSLDKTDNMSAFTKPHIIQLQEVSSTNRYAQQHLHDQEVTEGTIFISTTQTAGKGQGNNQWESEPGQNITCSIILTPTFLPIEEQFKITQTASLGIIRAIQPIIPDANITIKWPNDIYVDNRKICGILIQNTLLGANLQHSIIGIGLNVNQEIFISDAPNPVSLQNITHQHHPIDALLKTLFNSIWFYYQKLCSDEFKIPDQLYHTLLYRKDSWHRYKDNKGAFEGKITGTGAYGHLNIIDREYHTRSYDLKEIKFLL